MNSDVWGNWNLGLALGVPAAFAGFRFYREKLHKNTQAFSRKLDQHVTVIKNRLIELGFKVEVEEIPTNQNRAADEEQMNNCLQVIEECTRLLELNPNYVKLLTRRAEAYWKAGLLLECIEDITMVYALDNYSNPKINYFTNNVLEELGRMRASAVMKSNPINYPSATYVWDFFFLFSQDPIFKYKEKSSEITYAVDSPFKKALKEFFSNDFNNTVRLCTEEMDLEVSEHKLEAVLLRGAFYYFSGQFDLAEKDWRSISDAKDVDTSEIMVNVLLKLARLKVEMDKIDEAIEIFKKAEEVDPLNPDIYALRGWMHFTLENWNLALMEFDKSISLNDELPAPQFFKCRLEMRRLENGKNYFTDEMRDYLDALTKKFPLSSEMCNLHGQVFMDFGEYSEAEKLFDKAISLDTTNLFAYTNKAKLIYNISGDIERVREILGEALRIDERCSFVISELAKYEFLSGNMGRSRKAFQRAIDCLNKDEEELASLYRMLLTAEFQEKVDYLQQKGSEV